MTLGDLMVVTKDRGLKVQDQAVSFYPERDVYVTCFAHQYEKWGPYAERKVTGIRALARDWLDVILEPTKTDDDPQIPGQMDLTDYGIKGG